MNIDLLRKLTVKVNDGSGCIFITSAEYAYVLTARHCIVDLSTQEELTNYSKDLSTVNVWADTAKEELQKFSVLDYFVSDDIAKDIAIIIISETSIASSIHYQKPNYQDGVLVYGYPGLRQNELDPRDDIQCTVGLESADGTGFDLVSKNNLYSFTKTALDNVEGLSGSGVFAVNGNTLQLLGILTNIKNPDGSLDKLQAVYINNYNELLSQNTYSGSPLKPLVPAFLTSFEHYINELFQFNNYELREVLVGQAEELFASGLTPKLVADFLNEKIFLPHNKGIPIDNPELWQGWLEFLTYLSFDNDEDKFCNLPKSLLRPNKNINKKYFYYLVEGHTWTDAIRFILIKSDKRFQHGSKFFINNGSRPLKPNILSSNVLDKIISDISDGDSSREMNRRLRIDKSKVSAEYSFIHLEQFSTLFTDPSFDEIQDAEELKMKIQAQLKEISFHE